MFKDIMEYIKSSREERRSHLDLSQPCVELGGTSQEFRGLLAYFLKTTLSEKKSKPRINLCHACNNSKCSNVNHLYWGTNRDNLIDSHAAGNYYESVYARTVRIYGKEKAKDFFSQASKKAGGKNKLTSEKLDCWRIAIQNCKPETPGGISRLSREMNCSHTQVRRILKKYFSND